MNSIHRIYRPKTPTSSLLEGQPCKPQTPDWEKHKQLCREKICKTLMGDPAYIDSKENVEKAVGLVTDSVKFVSFETFNEALLSSFDRVIEGVQQKPYGIFFQNGRNKSGVWVYQLLKDQRVIKSVAIRTSDNIIDRNQFLSREEDYADDDLVDSFEDNLPQINSDQLVEDWIFFDDASYSGQQMRDQVSYAILQLLKSIPKGRPLNIHVCIPFMTTQAANTPIRMERLKEQAANWEIDEAELERVHVKTYPSKIMKTFSQKVVGHPQVSLISKIFEHLVTKASVPPQFCNVTLTFFEHKLPDDKSCVRTFVTKYQGLSYEPIDFPKVSPPYKTEEFQRQIKASETKHELFL